MHVAVLLFGCIVICIVHVSWSDASLTTSEDHILVYEMFYLGFFFFQLRDLLKTHEMQLAEQTLHNMWPSLILV